MNVNCLTIGLLASFLVCPGFAEIDASGSPYNVSGSSSSDQSSGIQAALDQAASNGGDRVVLPSGTIYAKELELPSRVTLCGQGIDATRLKLPSGANTFLAAVSTYTGNYTFCNSYGGVCNLTFDGNKDNNSSGSLLILKSYRFLAENCVFIDSPLHGVLISAFSEDGTTNSNGMAENRIVKCFFHRNNGAGIYAHDGGAVRIADGFIENCAFSSNGSLGYYQIELERSAGFHITGNHVYGSVTGDLMALDSAALIVSGNNFDGTENVQTNSNGYVESVVIETGGWRTATITGNVFHNHATVSRDWNQLVIANNVSADSAAVMVSGNIFSSQYISVNSISLTGSGVSNIVLSGNAFSANSPAP